MIEKETTKQIKNLSREVVIDALSRLSLELKTRAQRHLFTPSGADSLPAAVALKECQSAIDEVISDLEKL